MTISFLNNKFVTQCLGIVFFSLFSIINGYPVVYSDTSTYLASGFELQTPFDRPITYGVFLRLTSLNGFSLWLPVVIQSLLLTWLIREIYYLFVERENKHGKYLTGVFLILSLTTSVSWISSQLIPDVFTPMLVMLSFLLLFKPNLSKLMVFLLLFLFLVASAMHASHILYNLIFICFLLILKWRNYGHFNIHVQRFKVIWVMLLLTGVAILSMGSSLSKSKHVFFMGAMVEHGITKKFLDENCSNAQYKLCQYKDSLPDKAWEFIWNENSPFHKTGGWKESKKEYNEIIIKTLSSPKYLWWHTKASALATIDQLLKFKMGDGYGPFKKGTLLNERVKKYFPHEYSRFNSTLQSRNAFANGLQIPNLVNIIFVCISILALIYFISRNRENKLFFLFVIFVVTGIVLHAWVCGTFANAIDRMGCRMIWLIPFTALTGLLIHLMQGLKSKSSI